MIDIVLVHPEIPPNTGNVIRLAANTGARLHLVEPLGFSMDDRQLKRAGLDYHELASVRVHPSWSACRASLGERRFFAFAPRAATLFTEVRYATNDVLVFGQSVSDEFLNLYRAGCFSAAELDEIRRNGLSDEDAAVTRSST